MHRLRSAARATAWWDEEGDPPSYNPFRKLNPRRRRGGDDEEVARTSTIQSENDATTSREQNRIDERIAPRHPNTFPPNHTNQEGHSPTYHPQYPIAEKEKEGSEESTAGRSATVVVPDADREGNCGIKQRKSGFMSKFHKKEKNQDDRQTRSTSGLTQNGNKHKFTPGNQLKRTLFNSWINVLLIMAPVGIAVNYAHVQPVAVFVINFIAIIPLAAMLSYATEEIAIRTGETLGGLLNATFGNAVELIVSILALVKNEVLIVQTSLIGSILSNLLLVMGMCFFFGGINRPEQHFNMVVAQTASSLLALAVASLIIPTAFSTWASGDAMKNASNITALSRGTSVLLLLVYGAYLFFQLKTHADMYNEPSQKVERRQTKKDIRAGLAKVGAGMAGTSGATSREADGSNAQDSPLRHPDEEDKKQKDEPQLHIWVAVATLAISTALVAVCAEFMVDSINAITAEGGISKTFVGLILLPIVGNAAEHATAVTVAVKDKMDLAIGVAVGSSMQIALLVIPFVVVLGWILGKDDMNLSFDGFQIAILFVAVLLVNYLIQDGKSHWLEGVLLQTLYLIIAIAAWFYPANGQVS
ncbi:MAG: sodium calcium transporter [Lasallia pustulata]|uniref:Sodium calcium transporter n=1 Tax=Lasallia pustulata TaxID=136370 RepID=A0A5M8PIX7_9LECA|nr:MAG: sodium calcium transporter [Lasallia pustulata]